MTKNYSKIFGPLLILIAVLFIAIISIVRPEKTQIITGSVWFLVFGIIVTIRSLSVVFTVSNKSYIHKFASIIIHLGIVIGLVGVYINERSHRNGYVFLKLSSTGKNLFLTKNLKAIDELPFTIRLDSITFQSTKGFQPAPYIWVYCSSDNQSMSSYLTYNHPLNYHKCQLLLSNIIEPGFPHTYELTVGNEQYKLLHNQKLRLPDKTYLSSFAYDADENQIGLIINNQEQWFQVGETKQVANNILTITSIDFAQNQGVIFFVKDMKLRLIIFTGFGVMLLSLIPFIFTRRVL